MKSLLSIILLLFCTNNDSKNNLSIKEYKEIVNSGAWIAIEDIPGIGTNMLYGYRDDKIFGLYTTSRKDCFGSVFKGLKDDTIYQIFLLHRDSIVTEIKEYPTETYYYREDGALMTDRIFGFMNMSSGHKEQVVVHLFSLDTLKVDTLCGPWGAFAKNIRLKDSIKYCN
jgi:hypothetical protein